MALTWEPAEYWNGSKYVSSELARSEWVEGAYYATWPIDGGLWALRLYYYSGDQVQWTALASEADAKREAQEHDTGYSKQRSE